MAKTLAAHRSGLLAYYDVMISSGPMEGTNNKIKTMKRQAYGFRDLEFFKLKILAIHERSTSWWGEIGGELVHNDLRRCRIRARYFRMNQY